MRRIDPSAATAQGALPFVGDTGRRHRTAFRPGNDPVGLVLAPCSRERAREATRAWHYIGTVPAITVAQFEVVERGRFIGAIVFGAGPRFLTHGFDCAPRQACELSRVALDRHDAPVSRVVSIALRLLIGQRRDLRLVVSYADARAGHHGGIYQAGGWTYTGGSETHAYRIHGREMHPRTVGTIYGSQSVPWLRANVDPDAGRVTTGTKHRYLLGLDAGMRAQVAALAKPFPRRVKQAMAGPTGTAAGQN